MKLLFVYNANSGAINGLLDSAHKLIQPETYACKLCEITHGVFSEKEELKSFREASKSEMVFLHKDEFLKQYNSKWLPKYDFPIILSEENNELFVFISSIQLEKLKGVKELISQIEKRSN